MSAFAKSFLQIRTPQPVIFVPCAGRRYGVIAVVGREVVMRERGQMEGHG